MSLERDLRVLLAGLGELDTSALSALQAAVHEEVVRRCLATAHGAVFRVRPAPLTPFNAKVGSVYAPEGTWHFLATRDGHAVTYPQQPGGGVYRACRAASPEEELSPDEVVSGSVTCSSCHASYATVMVGRAPGPADIPGALWPVQ